MNRFRQLKQKLIKSKRDSQKLQQLPCSQKELQDWVQKQLQYYGIRKESYRLKQLKNVYQEGLCVQNEKRKQPNPESSVSCESIDGKNLEKAFVKKTNVELQGQSQKKQINISFGQQKPRQENGQVIQPSVPSRKLICKKPRNEHLSSMNDAQKLQQSTQKESQNFRSYQQIETQASESSQQKKQLDYYTLILQLTAELNYSRLNKQTSNEKSILNQIKNLISYIQGKTSCQASKNPTNMKQFDKSPSSICHIAKTGKKSNHTFSSVGSHQSLINYHQSEEFKCDNFQGKRIIRHKLLEVNESSANNGEDVDENEENNKTFESVNGFEEEENQEKNGSIIDLVHNNQDDSEQKDLASDILIQQSQSHQNSLMQGSPLSRITEHESQYTQSATPSIVVSPSKFTPHKSHQSISQISHNSQTHSTHNLDKIQVSLTPCQSHLPYTSPNHQINGQLLKTLSSLPQNQLILKKLSDKFENTQESQHVFQNSLEYRRILYMLDSEYSGSDLKNRTFASMIGTQNLGTLWERNLFGDENVVFKGESQSSAKSFIKEVFEPSEGSSAGKNSSQSQQNKKEHSKTCLMHNLDLLFNKQHNRSIPNDSQILKNHHKRYQTTYQHPLQQNLNKTTKYKFNLLSQLFQQCTQSEHQYNKKKYECIKTEYEDQSIYHKVSRNSFLTAEQGTIGQGVTSLDSEVTSSGKREIKKGNIIVKKCQQNSSVNSFRASESLEPKKTKFVVKKSDKQNISGHEERQKLDQHHHVQGVSKLRHLLKKSSSPSIEESQKYHISPQQKLNHHYSSIESSQQQKRSVQNRSFTSNRSPVSSGPKKSSQKQNSNSQNHSSSVIQQSKNSLHSSRLIKYKVYPRTSEFSGKSQKEDKRKVLKDIVQMLNTKYNKNIVIGQ